MSRSEQNRIERTFRRAGDWFNRNASVVPLLLFLGLAGVYLTFPTRNYYWDGIVFAHAIENAERPASLIHPNHLLYNFPGYLFYHCLHLIGFHVRAVTALQSLNAITSALASLVLFFTLRTVFRSLYLATFLTLLFALSATWWKFSSDANAYIVSVLFILIAFRLVLPSEKPKPLVVAVMYTASMCFHQLAIFFGPVIALGLAYQSEKTNAKGRVSTLVQFGLLSLGLTTTIYLYCFYLSTHTLSPGFFLRWITSYSPDASFTFNVWQDLRYTLRGHVRLFFSGRFNLIKGLIGPIILVLFGVLILDFALLVYLVFKNLRRPKLATIKNLLNDAYGRPLFLLAAMWLVIYLVFLFVWLPQNTFYRLFYLPSLIVSLGLFAWTRYGHEEYRPSYRLATFTIALAIANFLFFIFPYAHAEKFPPTRFALEMGQQWPARTLIYYDLDSADKNLMSYFAPATTWMRLQGPEMLENRLREMYKQGWTVWLETSAIDRLSSSPERAQWLASHTKKESRRELQEQGFRIEFVQVVP